MENSLSIKEISKALLAAQKEMVNAKKGSNNPFFKSKYADLNSVREACMSHLNDNGISILQPTVCQDGKNYVKTILLHESGEYLSCLTEILFSKLNDAQAQGSGITYARRYGMQSFVNIGVEDDDGNSASAPQKVAIPAPVKAPLPTLKYGTPEWANGLKALRGEIEVNGNFPVYTIDDLRKKYTISAENAEMLKQQTQLTTIKN